MPWEPKFCTIILVAVTMTFLTLSSGDQQIVQLSFLKFSNSPRTCICVWIVFYFCIICTSLPAMGVSLTQRWTELVQCFLYKTAWSWHCFIGELQYLWLLMEVLKKLFRDWAMITMAALVSSVLLFLLVCRWRKSGNGPAIHFGFNVCERFFFFFFTIWDEGHTKTSA